MSENTQLETPELNADLFRDRLNESFRIHVDDQVVDAELVEVAGLGGHTARKDRSPFSLMFRGPEGLALQQATYRFENDTLGGLDLFMVCVGPDPDDRKMRYQVIFT